MGSRRRKHQPEEQSRPAREDLLDRPIGGPSGQVLVSQQDYDSDWLRIDWPPTGKIDLPCANQKCSSKGFDWEKLESAIAAALEEGNAVAGSLRCEGMDMLAMSRCSNALVYIWDGDQLEEDL
jgi:hypothetical protein